MPSHKRSFERCKIQEGGDFVGGIMKNQAIVEVLLCSEGDSTEKEVYGVFTSSTGHMFITGK